MIFSYRTRQFLRRVLSGVLPAVLLIVMLLVCWLFWLQRFILYTPEGAVLNFELSAPLQPGIVPQAPQVPQISIEFNDAPSGADTPQAGLQQLNGYYIDPDALIADVSAVRAKLETLDAGTPVLLDVKSAWGYFFYSTSLGETAASSYNIPQMDELIAYLQASDLYVIARLPALRDHAFALNNTDCGILGNRGYLWEDTNHCHWLDPTKDGTLTHLIQIVRELRTLGFDEVVFQDFYIPDSTVIVFEGDRAEAIQTAAQTLVSTCATEYFTVSFATTDPGFQIPASRSRLYLMDVAAADVSDVLDQVLMADTAKKLVFFAQTNDTRYEVCGVLRPLELAR